MNLMPFMAGGGGIAPSDAALGAPRPLARTTIKAGLLACQIIAVCPPSQPPDAGLPVVYGANSSLVTVAGAA